MFELCRPSVQAVSDLILHGEGSVKAVIDDMKTRERELGTDLVRDPRKDCDAQERAVFVPDAGMPDGLVVRHRVQGLKPPLFAFAKPIVMRVNHPTEGDGRIVHEVILESIRRVIVAFHEREVGLLDCLRGKLGAERGKCLDGACDEDEPRGRRVNSMEGSREKGTVTQGSAFGIVRDHAIHKRRRFAVRERLDGEPSGLVAREKCRVRINDVWVNRGIWGDKVVRFLGETGDFDVFSAHEAASLREERSVHFDRTCRDRLTGKGAGRRGKCGE